MSWSEIEKSIWRWVHGASGLEEREVIWAEQGGGRPSSTLYTLKILDVTPLGAFDELVTTYNSADTTSQVKQSVKGQRQFTVRVQYFGDEATGDGAAVARLAQVAAHLRLPSVRAVFEAAGCAVNSVGQVQNISTVQGTSFESRAALDVVFSTVVSVDEYAGFIETIETESFMGPPDSGNPDTIDI